MDIEQLKVVMDTLNGLGDDAVRAFIAYLCVYLVVNVMGYIVGMVAIVYLVKAVKWIAHCIRSTDTDYIRSVKEGVNLDAPFMKTEQIMALRGTDVTNQ